MNTLTLSVDQFFEYLPKLIESGVTFNATTVENNVIIKFTGGY